MCVVVVGGGAGPEPRRSDLLSGGQCYGSAHPNPTGCGLKDPAFRLPARAPLCSRQAAGADRPTPILAHCPLAPPACAQSSPDNPPLMLPCGHCMCKQSALKIAKAVGRSFKCPYCPAEASLFQCTELIFPDAE